jgi:uncharacterized protein (TIRG00374 family)
MKRLRPALSLLLKAVVSLGILAFLLTRIDGMQLLRVLSAAHVGYLVTALVGYFVGQLVSSFRWALLARPLGFKNPLRDFVSIYFIGMFFNLFAPSTVGGDFGRVYYLARGRVRGQGQDWAGSTASALISVITDRAVGMAALVWMGAAALLLFPSYSIPSAIRYLTDGLALAFILGWFFLPLLHGLLERKAHPIAENVRLAIGTYRKNQQVLSQTILLSLIVHFIQATMHLFLGRALAVEIPYSYCFIIYPLVGLFSALPISVNGFGLREGGYLFLLQLIDVAPEKAIAFGLLLFVIVALDSLFGAVLFVLRGAPKPSAVASEADHQVR